MIKEITSKFTDLYNYNPLLFRSPGRINIIGEHTDYNEGFVLPAAIDKELIFAVYPNTVKTLRAFAFDLDKYTEIPIQNIQKQLENNWVNYLTGIIYQLSKRNINIDGIDVVVGGNIPIGAGLSSSAAMECGFVFALNSIFSLELKTIEMVKMAQMAEHEFAGVMCGIMDQFAVMHGKEKMVMKLDCRSLDFRYEPLDLKDHTILLCDTKVKHNLASSEYNIRRQECEEGVKIVAKNIPDVLSLRDVSLEQLEICKSEMNPTVYSRCKFVIEENLRLDKTCNALEKNDIATVGNMLYGSHDGLKNMYSVSCSELDQLVEIAQNTQGVAGARMMGGGFGGCTITILHKEAVPDFKNKVNELYYRKNGISESFYEVRIREGTSQIL
jgi:galactokinase